MPDSMSTPPRAIVEEAFREQPHSVRVRLALLKIAVECDRGDRPVEHLEAALDHYFMDWRDLLISAGFAEDVSAHDAWAAGQI